MFWSFIYQDDLGTSVLDVCDMQWLDCNETFCLAHYSDEQDHLQEILRNWDRIDDEIWAKIVCMQKNRRIAKAFARAPVISINGSYIGFDGHRIGLNGFAHPLIDHEIEDLKNNIGSGAKIKIDDEGESISN